MNFYIYNQGFSVTPEESQYVVLYWDNWNDFSYCTLFRAGLVTNNTELSLGEIKIACNDEIKEILIKNKKLQELIADDGEFYDYNQLVPTNFEKLPNGFFSIGSISFYENLRDLDNPSIRTNILNALNDLSFNLDLVQLYIDVEHAPIVVTRSILRDSGIDDIKYQLHRIAKGGVTLTPYNINLKVNDISNTQDISFSVKPNSTPPSNVHAIIGSNGAGKSYLLRKLTKNYLDVKENSRGYQVGSRKNKILNLISISFSPFDRILQDLLIDEKDIKYIGLRDDPTSTKNVEYKSRNDIEQEFITNVLDCSKSLRKKELWHKITTPLETDYLFKSINLTSWHDNEWYEKYDENAGIIEDKLISFFREFGSGHRIIILILSILVNSLKEKTLVLFDEPETYLHPPLLSALMRSISLLAEERNGIVIMATHSPIVLQELPKNCIWKIHRYGHDVSFSRPTIETFGENSSIINKEVFALETERAGFIQYIDKIIKKILITDADLTLDNAFHLGLSKFNYQLGSEGRVILLSKLKQELTKVKSDV